MTRREKLAYLAGLIDGEGHYYKPAMRKKNRKRTYYYPRIVVCQKEREVMDWLKENYGGCVYLAKKRSNELKRDFEVYYWTLTGKRVTELAHAMLPFVIVKKEQIKRVL